MSTRENQRVKLTKRLLQENLLKLMAEKDIQHITVRELCAAAEINRSTFYNHYGCPADILTEIENSVIADLERIWQEGGKKKDWSMVKRVERLCSYLQEHRDLAKLLFRNSDTNSGFAALMLKAAHVRATYEEELEELSYAKSQESKQLIITFLTHGTYHMLRQWILEDIPKTPKEMGELACLVATQGWSRSYGKK